MNRTALTCTSSILHKALSSSAKSRSIGKLRIAGIYFAFFMLFFTTGCGQKKEAAQNNVEQVQEKQIITNTQQNEQEPADQKDDVKIQGMIMDMAGDMAIMLGAQQGASLANAQITSEGQLLATKISQDSQAIQTNMQGFQQKAQVNQQTKLQAMMSAFSTAQQNIQSQTAQAADISNLQLNYLYQNISIDQPQQNYIFNQIEFDQLFSLGAMLTPQGALWINPFSVGDWEFDGSSNSFWQYQSSPIFSPAQPASNGTPASPPSSLQAENNSIFTEYCTSAQNYTIAASISLNSISYPFFAGIIFNKARWISGDFEAIRKCRMIGIYGASPTDIGVYFAQQYTMTDAQLAASGSSSPIQTPLQQILTGGVQKSINLPGTVFATVPSSPLTFNFEITNSPTNVSIKFWSGSNPAITVPFSGLDPSIFMFHGIGFICPGAVAQFTLTQPTDLVFTAQAISNYKD